jgi:pectinesterase inhibitor-like protein
MEARSVMSWYCSTILAVVVALFLSASLGTGTGAGADLKGPCAATPHPEACVSALQKDAVARKGAAATARDLAEAAIRAATNAGAAAGDYAHQEMDVVKDNGMWQCLNECAEDIEEALSHLDDSEGGVDDAKLKEVKLFLDTAEEDAWNCDQSCKGAANTTVKATLLAKNKDFENLMAVTLALLKRVTGGDDAPGAAPAKP